MEGELIRQLASTGVVGLVAAGLAWLAWTQRAEIVRLWEARLAEVQKVAELGASMAEANKSLALSIETRSASIDKMAEAASQTARTVDLLSKEIAANGARIERLERELANYRQGRQS